jgi:hypothetical protein
LHKSWHCSGKKNCQPVSEFRIFLEENTRRLQAHLAEAKHAMAIIGSLVTDNKRRMIKVAGIRDRVVHRLIYEYLSRFSTRYLFMMLGRAERARLIGAIRRKDFAAKPATVWRSDVRNF